MSNDTLLEGGCLCREVRYQARGPIAETGYCHCRMCQLASGSPMLAFVTVPFATCVVVAGNPTRRRSSDFGERWFCPSCGTPLGMRVDHQPDTIDLTLTTLDDPEMATPSFHIWTQSKPSWHEIGDDLPQFSKFRPSTAGLGDAAIEGRRL